MFSYNLIFSEVDDGSRLSSREVHGVHEAGQGLLGEEHEQGDEMLRSGEDASGPVLGRGQEVAVREVLGSIEMSPQSLAIF